MDQKNKFCPLMSGGERNFFRCQKGCAWFSKGQCVLVEISDRLSGIDDGVWR